MLAFSLGVTQQYCNYIHLFSEGEFLVMHLAELVRMAFIAGTSNNDQLKLAGIKILFVS